ncbi:sensor histidine kinase [Brevibacterium casei]|uniref:histidine kinase n=3 Tax=Bacteria TaxID=2 RepID=A0A2H1HRS4_9MICO|nr:sensor histidine kinase [Brevibacterium casei]MCT1549440.1 sensor histidine kinase [Brevibacterium casei]MCT1560388.1 sensor histidine kinase [Brevibacterium casei]MCT2206704.1 sensor histidine kinase [Brevibacterium casei]SMX65618.1 Signal transduction histidine kinase [Brevibacterium casei CIP 102111]
MGSHRWTARTMEIGQHAIAVVLTVISSLRAITAGAPVLVVVAVSLVLLAWYGFGAVRAARSGSVDLARWWLLVLAAIWLLMLVVSAEFIWVAFLLWLLAGHLFSLRIAVVFTAVTYLATVAAPLIHHGRVSTPAVIGSLIGAVFALGLSRGYIELLREGRRREELLQSLEAAHRSLLDVQDELALTQRHAGEIEERTRVSRDIHDTVAQEISSIRLIAHAEADRTTDAHAAQVLRQVEDLAAQGSRDVRRIIAALAPAELEDAALPAAIGRLLSRLESDTTILADLTVDESWPALPAEAEVALLRTAQSALANVRQHAQATRVRVSLSDLGDSIRMDIVDDGVGLADPQTRTRKTDSGFGLDFIASRMRELGGELDIETAPGAGFAISATLPRGGRR